jgi:hypothetical protein
MAMALPLHWVSAPMRFDQNNIRIFSTRIIPLMRAREGTHQSIASRAGARLGKHLGMAGFYFFMVKGVLWLLGLSFVYVFGL